MSVAGKSVGDATPATAYQPVRAVDGSGNPVTPSGALVNADGSQNIGGVDGATKATNANPVPVAFSGSGASSPQTQGTAATNATPVGNPNLIALRYLASPTPAASGQQITAWASLLGAQIVALPSATTGTVTGQTFGAFSDSGASSRLLAVANFVSNGTDNVVARGDANGTVTQPYALADTHWSYAAAAGGISNTTTAVTIKASAGGALKNCITAIQISAGTLGAATEVAIRDGAGGTVLWRGFLPTGGGQIDVTFPTPLVGTAATLLEAVTLSATVTGGVYVNVQGFTR